MSRSTKLLAKMVIVACSWIAVLAASPVAAASVGDQVIALFPKDVTQLAYVDLDGVKSLKWYPGLKAQLLPPSYLEFEKFIATSNGASAQIHELVWGVVPNAKSVARNASNAIPSGFTPSLETGDDIVCVALGAFDPDAAEAFAKSHKQPITERQGYTFYSVSSGSSASGLFVIYVDTGTAIVGPRTLLERFVDVGLGLEESLLRNDQLYPLIAEARGTGMIWNVLDSASTQHLVRQFAPDLEQFEAAQSPIRRMQNLIVTMDAEDSLDGELQAICGSTNDANLLAVAIQAGLLLKRYLNGQKNADLA